MKQLWGPYLNRDEQVEAHEGVVEGEFGCAHQIPARRTTAEFVYRTKCSHERGSLGCYYFSQFMLLVSYLVQGRLELQMVSIRESYRTSLYISLQAGQ